jgi:hypothetical protein
MSGEWGECFCDRVMSEWCCRSDHRIQALHSTRVVVAVTDSGRVIVMSVLSVVVAVFDSDRVMSKVSGTSVVVAVSDSDGEIRGMSGVSAVVAVTDDSGGVSDKWMSEVVAPTIA